MRLTNNNKFNRLVKGGDMGGWYFLLGFCPMVLIGALICFLKAIGIFVEFGFHLADNDDWITLGISLLSLSATGLCLWGLISALINLNIL